MSDCFHAAEDCWVQLTELDETSIFLDIRFVLLSIWLSFGNFGYRKLHQAKFKFLLPSQKCLKQVVTNKIDSLHENESFARFKSHRLFLCHLLA